MPYGTVQVRPCRNAASPILVTIFELQPRKYVILALLARRSAATYSARFSGKHMEFSGLLLPPLKLDKCLGGFVEKLLLLLKLRTGCFDGKLAT